MTRHQGHRDVVVVGGADAAEYLQGQVSQDVDGLMVGSNAWSLVLQPQGKVDALFRITRVADDRFLLDVDPGWGEVLRDRLRRFLLRMDVSIELETWPHHAYRDEQPDDTEGAPIVATVDWSGRVGLDVVGPDLSDLDGAEPTTGDDYQRRRIEAGVPAMGRELDESTIPAEAGDVSSWVSFTKGCYTGQELVARVDSRGSNTRRSLHRFRGSGDPPGAGTEARLDDDVVGTLTTAARTEDGWVALGYLKRGVTTDRPVSVGGIDGVSIETLAGES